MNLSAHRNWDSYVTACTLYDEGKSFDDIADGLNQFGAVTTKFKAHNKRSIRRLFEYFEGKAPYQPQTLAQAGIRRNKELCAYYRDIYQLLRAWRRQKLTFVECACRLNVMGVLDHDGNPFDHWQVRRILKLDF